MAGDTCFRTTSTSVAIEDIRIDDIIWGVNIEEREVKQRWNTESTNTEGMSNSGGILKGAEHGRVRKEKV